MKKGTTRFDWEAVQAAYDTGLTVRECRRRFGFSTGAWSHAVDRGDLVPRPRASGRRGPDPTRAAVGRLLSTGTNQADVSRALGLSKATVAYHARQLGIAADPRFTRRYDWAAVQAYYDAGHSITACQAHFGLARKTFNDARKRGDVLTRPQAMPIEKLLARPRSRPHVKARLLRLGLKHAVCEGCGLTAWRDAPLPLELHHVNGDGHDNRLENLQLLCPNCHSQTDNWGGRNRRAAAAPRA
jgi:5-methylcytosine-specific restriction endonuclease McrA